MQTVLIKTTDARTDVVRQSDTAEAISRYDKKLIRAGVVIIAAARENLALTNAKLAATQVLLAESYRMSERLKILLDLHDAPATT
jgi:hypothetical protein